MTGKAITEESKDPQRMIELLKEYGQKMEQLLLKIDSVRNAVIPLLETSGKGGKESEKEFQTRQMVAARVDGLMQFTKSMKSALDELRRRSSQWIEHGRKATPDSVELRLRVTELEALMKVVEKEVYSLPNL